MPTRWDQVALTVGIGWDLRLAKSLYLRPILNAAVARVTSDTALAGQLIEFRTDRDLAFLDRGRLNAWGLGGSLVLAYYDHLPAREIDVELRGTQLHLQTFGDTSAVVRGDTEALTVGLWGRLRWPTGTRGVRPAGTLGGGGAALPLLRRAARRSRLRAPDEARRRPGAGQRARSR